MKKKLLCVFLSLLTTSDLWALVIGQSFRAETVEGVEMLFMVNSDGEKTCQVGEFSGSSTAISINTTGTITIPETINGYTVTGIGSGAFSGCAGLTSINIPESVTDIYGQAFYGCTGLTSLTLPNSVTGLGKEFIGGCTNLTSITIPNSVTTIYSQTFYNCTNLTSITIPESVTTIYDEAFYGCTGLTSITIPESVTTIYGEAFANCQNLSDISFPNSIEYVSRSAFDETAWYNNQSDGLIYIGSLAYIYKETIPENTVITLKDGTTAIGEYAFVGCTGITSITIPESVISIGAGAFADCTGLTSITIPENVTSIGDFAFSGCSGLISITIPEGVTNIGNYAFQSCSGLTSITIPESVTSIGDGAFYGCSSLTSITIPEGVTSIGNSAFQSCSGLTSITIPESVTSIESNTFSGCSGLTSITIPEGVTNIGNEAFYGCSNLADISYPNSLESIGWGAFSRTAWYNNLSEGVVYLGKIAYKYKGTMPENTVITLKEGTVIIGGGAFSGCTGLTSITIPEGVTNIGNEAFYGCTGLTSITIPESVVSIGGYAFHSSGLNSITIPKGVVNIGEYAFPDCEVLDKVIILNNSPELLSIVPESFTDYSWRNRETLYVPQGTKNAYSSIWWGSQFEKIIELADADVTLGKNVVSFASEQMLDFSTPIEDLKAYIVSGISSDGKAIINEVTGAVPSGTGLILKGTAGHSYAIPYTTTVPDAVSNMLVGVTEDTEIGGNDLDYILSDGKFVKASYGTLPAGKAYLKLDEALARSIITIGDEATGIKAVDGAPTATGRYYNLNGQRVSTPQKGLYIVNGKKVAKK